MCWQERIKIPSRYSNIVQTSKFGQRGGEIVGQITALTFLAKGEWSAGSRVDQPNPQHDKELAHRRQGNASRAVQGQIVSNSDLSFPLILGEGMMILVYIESTYSGVRFLPHSLSFFFRPGLTIGRKNFAPEVGP